MKTKTAAEIHDDIVDHATRAVREAYYAIEAAATARLHAAGCSDQVIGQVLEESREDLAASLEALAEELKSYTP